MTAVFLLSAFVFGAFIGSFLNVCIHRLPRNESVVQPPSRCYSCGTLVQWYDNLPIIGWLVLGGRCRWCGTGFSSRYLWSEVLVGLLTAGTWWYATEGGIPSAGHAFVPSGSWQVFGVPAPVATGLVVGALLPAVYLAFTAAMIDRDHEIIPDELTVPFQAAAPFLAALATTPFVLGSPQVIDWLVVRDLGGASRADPAHFLSITWMVVLGALAVLAASLAFLRWIYGPRLGPDAWGEGARRGVVTGFWWFAVATLVQLVACTVLAQFQESGGKPTVASVGSVLLAQAIFGSLAGWALPWMIGMVASTVLRRDGMGFGDVKFLAPLGAFIGPLGVVYCFFAAALIGTLLSARVVPLILINWLSRLVGGREVFPVGHPKLRFGPCLALGVLVVLAAGPQIQRWLAASLAVPGNGG